jgi:hypothetical protein
MLKYNIRKRKHWVHLFFCDSLNGGAYIVSREIPSHAKSILSCLAQSGWRLPYIPVSCSINYTKTNLAASSTFRAILINKWMTEARYRTADTKKPRGNGNCETSMLRCLDVEFLSFGELLCRFLNLHCSVQSHVFQLWLTLLGNCGCLGVPSPVKVFPGHN